MKRRFALILALIMMITALAGCGSEPAANEGTQAPVAADPADPGNQEVVKPEAPKQLDLVRVGITKWPNTLDPACEMGNKSTRWINQVFDSLLYAKEDGTIISYICESWEMIDELTAEFKLKSGITFHNGYPLTAEDIKYSYDRVLFDDTGYVDPNVTALIRTISSVDVVDELTLRITTANPDPILFNRLASGTGVFIISKQFAEEEGTDGLGTHPVGTGPYKIDSISPENMMLSYYEGYYGDAPVAKQMEYRYIAEETALITALITGEIDIAPDVSFSAASMLKAQTQDVTVVSAPTSTGHLLRFQTHSTDKYLRQALSLAIDRQLLVDTLWDGYASVPNGYNYAEFGVYYIEDYPEYEYNVEKAKELLAQSSYNGEVLSFQLIPGYYAMGAEAAEAIVDMWKEIGVNAQVEYVEAIKTSTIVDLANWSNGLRFEDPLGGMWALWGEGTGPQKDLWDAPERFNELGHLMETETDVEQRREYYREMMQIWDDEVPGTILYAPDTVWAVSNRLVWNYGGGRKNFRSEFLWAAE